ncbi:MAG: hypothetical protein H7Z73_01665 [Candidatus Saccharibacteria bacterium]|nr:hypothetical protein [Moraxellaceae bacterium]
MDDLVVIIMGVFIANYKTEEHPFLTCFLKAFLIALLAFLYGIGKDFVDSVFSVDRTIFSLKLAMVLWLVLSLLLIFIEFIFSFRK